MLLTAVVFRVSPRGGCPVRIDYSQATPHARIDRRGDCGSGLSVQLLRDGYTLGAALAGMGKLFPLVSGFLGWIACFLSGSDTAANLLFGNLQVAAAHQIGVNPILLAATNSSGAVTGR